MQSMAFLQGHVTSADGLAFAILVTSHDLSLWHFLSSLAPQRIAYSSTCWQLEFLIRFVIASCWHATGIVLAWLRPTRIFFYCIVYLASTSSTGMFKHPYSRWTQSSRNVLLARFKHSTAWLFRSVVLNVYTSVTSSIIYVSLQHALKAPMSSESQKDIGERNA